MSMERVVLVLNPGKCGSTWLAHLLHLPPALVMRGELDFAHFLTQPLAGQWNPLVMRSVRSHLIRMCPLRTLDEKLISLYARRLPPEGRLIDKSPSNLPVIERFLPLYRRSQIVILSRDPRDIYVSKERFHQVVLEKKAARPGLGDVDYLSSPECLLRDVFVRSRKLRALERRLTAEGYDCFAVKYEDLVSDFEPTATRLLRFLNVPVDSPAIRDHIRACETARVGNFRKGGTGDWRNHFTSPAALAFLHERFGHDLVDLGYPPE
jgi:hypothetical protein